MMTSRLHLAAFALAGFALVAALSGCGGVAKVKVKGTLMKDGKPLVVSKQTYVVLKFAPDVEKPLQTYPAHFTHETGGYSIEIPAGSYSARCVIMDVENQKVPTGPPQVFDLSKDQELDIDISPK